MPESRDVNLLGAGFEQNACTSLESGTGSKHVINYYDSSASIKKLSRGQCKSIFQVLHSLGTRQSGLGPCISNPTKQRLHLGRQVVACCNGLRDPLTLIETPRPQATSVERDGNDDRTLQVILEIGHFIKETGQVLEQRPVAMVLEPVNETSSRPSQQEHRSPVSEGRLQ